MTSVDANYMYWQVHGGTWATEYEDRKRRIPLYHIQELMLTEYMSAHANDAKPTRVLEFGCGVGRHLRNLSNLRGIDIFGFDQSPTMIGAMRSWADDEWIASRVKLGEPVGRLPYDDATFDIVYSTEVLVHVRPEHLADVLREIHRVARGHILHIEPAPGIVIHSNVHSGCWGHDLPAAYGSIGLHCETFEGGYAAHAPYVVTKGDKPRFFWEPWRLQMYRNCERMLAAGIEAAETNARLHEGESMARMQDLQLARLDLDRSNSQIETLTSSVRNLQVELEIARAENTRIREQAQSELERTQACHNAELAQAQEATQIEIASIRERANAELAAEREQSRCALKAAASAARAELERTTEAARVELEHVRALAAADLDRTKLETEAALRTLFEPRIDAANNLIAALESKCDSRNMELAMAALTRESLSEKLVTQQSRIEELSDTLRRLHMQHEHFTASVKRLVDAGDKPIPG